MNIISYDNLDNILSYLCVSDYKCINRYLYLKSIENASNIIKKYVRRYTQESKFIEKKLCNVVELSQEYNIIIKYIKLDLKKNLYIAKRNMKTVNLIIYNAEVKFKRHFVNIIERNNTNINDEFNRNFILNSEVAEVESKLIDLSFYILRNENKKLNKIQLKFINIFYKDFLNISKSIMYLENKIKKLVSEYIYIKHREFIHLTPFKDCMYNFVIYYIINNILNEMTSNYTNKLYKIYKENGFNSLIDDVEIDLNEYFEILY